jgi:thymidylate synthase (FAD)
MYTFPYLYAYALMGSIFVQFLFIIPIVAFMYFKRYTEKEEVDGNVFNARAERYEVKPGELKALCGGDVFNARTERKEDIKALCGGDPFNARSSPLSKEEYDIFNPTGQIVKVYNDGFVRLVEVTPAVCPKGRTPEFAIVRSARVSFGNGLKSQKDDIKLIEYLIKNKHTSPLESVQFTFHLRIPNFVAIHLLRHRTAKLNMFSQRYAEIKDDSYYKPREEKNGIRLQDKKNKQGSIVTDEKELEQVETIFKEIDENLDNVIQGYHLLIKKGVAKEVARYCLPTATYTELYYTLDLNNFIKFISLRNDSHAQYETQLCAKAMLELTRPYIPNVLKTLGF